MAGGVPNITSKMQWPMKVRSWLCRRLASRRRNSASKKTFTRDQRCHCTPEPGHLNSQPVSKTNFRPWAFWLRSSLSILYFIFCPPSPPKFKVETAASTASSSTLHPGGCRGYLYEARVEGLPEDRFRYGWFILERARGGRGEVRCGGRATESRLSHGGP